MQTVIGFPAANLRKKSDLQKDKHKKERVGADALSILKIFKSQSLILSFFAKFLVASSRLMAACGIALTLADAF